MKDEPIKEAVEEPKVDTASDEDDENFVYLLSSDLKSIEQIDDKFRNCYYHNLHRLIEDLETLVTNTIEKRCKNDLAKVYLTSFLCRAQENIR